MGAIFGIFKTCPKRSLGTPEKLRVVSSEAHVSFQIGSGFKNCAENQLMVILSSGLKGINIPGATPTSAAHAH